MTHGLFSHCKEFAIFSELDGKPFQVSGKKKKKKSGSLRMSVLKELPVAVLAMTRGWHGVWEKDRGGQLGRQGGRRWP